MSIIVTFSVQAFEELGQGVVEWELISRFFRDFCVIKVLRLIFCGKFCRLMFFFESLQQEMNLFFYFFICRLLVICAVFLNKQ